ncbi:FTR1 family protein [Tundrisphaera lichenicola]|uniref:FTR1 family protein n=1 Tax=Tundrisphaera lichenicola TaxID=2029860 RepID=UPI003EBAA55C
MLRSLLLVALLAASSSITGAAEVKGRVEMPDSCSPTVSPAVVTLEPADGAKLPEAAQVPAKVALVNQHGLQFEPRVQVIRVGQTLRFTNQDAETHNVHILTPGFPFNRSMAPNVPADFVPDKAGVIRLVCDIHTHMRGYVVATDSPWAKVCKGSGSFHFRDVPDGRYILNAWHEMGEPLRREVEVKDGQPVDLGAVVLKGYPVPASTLTAAPVRPWPEVIDRIGVLLSEARECAGKPEGMARARKLAEDAYWGEFETSDMETAVRRHLGYKRAGAIESQFLKLRSSIKSVAQKKTPASSLVTTSRQLLIDLSRASDDLRRLNVVDRRDVGSSVQQEEAVVVPGASERDAQIKSLSASFDGVRSLADAGQSSDASSAMTDAYFTDFEPLERLLNVRRPQEVRPLESRFNTIRGRVDSGLKGTELASELNGLHQDVVAALDRADDAVAGSFGLAFVNSLVTILREGVEVILLLTMLFALVAKAGQPKAKSAIVWGIGVAVLASAITAVGLNLLVGASQGRTREMVEGVVMMAAAGVLFSVSYWLISQTQAKKWAEFLKGRITEGAKVGGLGTLALTAFLAVYREGAETALLYQAMIAGQGGSSDGLMGLATGLGVGLVLLAVIAFAIRTTSARLPLRPFFKVTGFALFAMAVVFAGSGVFELQSAGYIKVTPIEWMGTGLPAIGMHPNVQAVSIQGLLLLGALLALVIPSLEGTAIPPKTKVVPPAAGVGA